RRRHTRCYRDWSSDVCSSDLADLILNLAVIYAWSGEKELALKQLAEAAQLPSSLNYGWLRLHPDWDPLRGDPRFEKILASLAPRSEERRVGKEWSRKG